MAIEMSDVIARNDVVLFTDFDGTPVIMHEGRYYELDPISGKILTLLDTGRPVAELCDALVAGYDIDLEVCRRDVLAFLIELEDMGIVRVNPASAGGPVGALGDRAE